MKHIAIPEKVVKARRRKNLGLIILLVLPILLSAVFLAMATEFLFDLRTADVTEISHTEIEKSVGYQIDELTVVDAYAEKRTGMGYDYLITNDNGYVAETYYLVSFKDKDGTLCYASFSTEKYSPFRSQLDAYMNDENSNVGDLIVSGCFTASPLYTGMQMDYFEDGYEDYNSLYPGEKVPFALTYEEATAAEYVTSKLALPIVFGVLGLLILGLSIFAMVRLIRKRRLLVSMVPVPSGEECVIRLQKRAKIATVCLRLALAAFAMGIVFPGIGAALDIRALMFIGGFTVPAGCFILAGWAAHHLSGKSLKMLAKEGITEVELAQDLENAVFLQERIRCGRRALLLDGNTCLPLNSILWIYFHETRNQFGIVVSRSVVIRTKDNQKLQIPTQAEDFNLFPALLNSCGQFFRPDLIVGFNAANKKAYSAIIKAQKHN